MAFLLNGKTGTVGRRALIMLATGTAFLTGSLPDTSSAGITGYVTIHNSRSTAVRVLVNWGFRGQVGAGSSRSFLVGDDDDATSWVTVETQSGYELKRFSYGSGYTDVEIWVD
jgi:hypothetical protein